MNAQEIQEIRGQLFKQIFSVDPVSWVENNLTMDGESFGIRGKGRKYLVDIYRYIAINALKPNGKPIVIFKGRQVEASTMALALDFYFMASGIFGTPTHEEMLAGVKKLSRIKVLHCFPQDKQTDRFIKEKANPFMNSARDDIVNKMKLKNGADTDRIKQFIGDNSLFMESTGVTGDRLRNLSADVIFFDEFQDFVVRAISNTTKIQMASRHGPHGKGIQVYFGTPKEKGSFFEKTWDKSDKRYYNLLCKRCKRYFPMFVPGTEDWKEIWIREQIISCPHCHELQDKLQAVDNGKWIPTVKGAAYVGFHFNRFIHPDTTKELIMDLAPENNPLTTDREYRNEVLGEFSSGEATPMTPQIIGENCADLDRSISRVGSLTVPTYLGIDWGKKVDGLSGGSSYSVAVLIEAHGDVMKIVNAFKLDTRGFSKKIEIIEEIFKRYNVKQAVADMGYGEDLVAELQSRLMSRVLGWYHHANYRNPYKFKQHDYYIHANKDRMVEHAFELMKNGKIRFPFKQQANIEWLVDHCCSMEAAQKIVKGQVFNTYIKGSGPNDGLVALTYALLAYKFVMTRGFTMDIMKIRPFQVKNPKPLAITGYVPGMR